MSKKIVNPSDWERPRGYSNGWLLEDGTLYVAGQIGWNRSMRFETTDFTAQVKQALHNVVAVVRSAGGAPNDVVRLTWYITDKSSYLANQRDLGTIYREIFGKHFPAMSVVVVQQLIEDDAKVEIEATAYIADQDTLSAFKVE